MNMKIEGVKFHQEILERFRLYSEACDPALRPKASAYATYLCLLEQCAKEYNSKGVVREFSLVRAAEKTGVPYGSLYDGLQYLNEQKFVSEEIHNGKSVWVLCDVERLNAPQRQGGLKTKISMNYFPVPKVIFETNILKELVRTSNANAFNLLFGLLNQFRVGLAYKSIESTDQLTQTYNMKTLKHILKKNAKGVRNVLDILSPIFDVHFDGVSARGKQIWIKRVQFNLKEECLKDDVDEYKVDSLMAKYNQDLIYFLDTNEVPYRPSTDLRDIVLSFKQEVIDRIKEVRGENNSFEMRDKWIREVYQSAIAQIDEKVHKMKKYFGKVVIYTLGGYFRKAFRRAVDNHYKNAPAGLFFDVKLQIHKQSLSRARSASNININLDDLPF
ncbi:hypothetical protein QTG56_23535 (plasmid) [Rossellomorea sp. AcN35-11]|nr:hypothetical protein [Rossellomorea aquimaris]WJV32337.1 hypothetical protein QTG56_23535 [Rossellomorea sp. AcN35-11]